MRAAALLVALAAVAAGAPAAAAADRVYGGTTAAGEAIVVKSDRAGKRVRSAVLAWTADCSDGKTYPVWNRVTAVRPSPGFSPDPSDLVMERNRGGRFRGTLSFGQALGGGRYAASVEADLSGTLRRGRASGTLEATAEIFDVEQGVLATTCRTGRVRWAASRGAGRIYGGATSQGEPFVARVDPRRRTVRDVHVGWHSSQCTPSGSVRVPDAFVDFPFDRRGRWRSTWDFEEPLDDGGTISAWYEFRGDLGGTSARGTLAVGVEQFDAAGARTVSCNTGTVRWRAASG
jgi:hypothetical protein